ncbi:MAG: PepSY domain-containing protein [Prevotella sp.]|nr:PepSY domain-containing protein [Prevotella sp.]
MRRILKWLHLWLGILSGIVVVIVCLTGGLYVFKDELTAIGEPWRTVHAENRPFLKPVEMVGRAKRVMGDASPSAITYGKRDEAVWVDYFQTVDGGSAKVFLNPYSGQVLHVTRHAPGDFQFFNFILQGHLRLWLPEPWGRQVVGYGILLFLITLLTGLFLWYPKRWSKKSVKSHFTVHRPFKFQRLMYDLHSVVGFYVLLPLIVASFTGLIFALDWVAKSTYYMMSGGKTFVEYEMPTSTSGHDTVQWQALNRIYDRISQEEPQAVQFYYALPQKPEDVYRVSIVHEEGSYYRQDNRFFDSHSGIELQGNGIYTGKYSDKTGADKFFRMGVDLHEGRVWGLFGRLLMLFSALVGASLPITGFILYYKRKFH